jgi:hypothetical protein
MNNQPRVYTYKITFEEVPYYYYGVHKEKRFDEYYMGSPYRNKWCWELYTPKRQILELFDFTDDGWIEAQEVERRLIKPVLNDKWCLNENVGGKVSLKISRETGERYKKLGIGVCGMSYEQRRKNGLKSSKWLKQNNKGIFGIPKEQRIETSRKSGIKTRDLKLGVHGLTREQKSEAGKKGGLKNKENKTGVCGMTKEQRQQNVKKTNSQRWQCTETGFITNSGSLSRYQKARGIDTSKRVRLE